jgi:RsiW-degrading membrane proteinase PrsW (M82 family)
VNLLPGLALGFVPVLLFLTGLVVMDSYRLVSRRAVLLSIAVGGLAALGSFAANRFMLDVLGVETIVLRRYLAPLVEEILKAVWVVVLIRSERVGFMVDAAIHGFAVGAGFALIENIYFMLALENAGVPTWLIRGLGTATLHGAMTAIVGIVAKGLVERRESSSLRWFVPGLAFAFAIHSAFNHVILHPLLSTTILLATMPVLLLVIFQRSEKATHDWLGKGLDTDAELLQLILSGEVVRSRVGEYLDSIKHRFAPVVVADMLCLLQIHVELSMRAKGILIARAAGVELEIDESVQANLRELRYLEKSIGETGLLAMRPLRGTSSRDLWQICVLNK